MLERFYPILKALCLILGALVLYQISRLTMRKDPLESLSFLATPSLLATSDNEKDKKDQTKPAPKETNSVSREESRAKATNSVPGARPSSGASSRETGALVKSSSPLGTSNVAASGDGRTPARATTVTSKQPRVTRGPSTPKASDLPPAI